jgi:hypothetical protein
MQSRLYLSILRYRNCEGFAYKNDVGLNLPKASKLMADSRKLLKLSRARSILVFSSCVVDGSDKIAAIC